MLSFKRFWFRLAFLPCLPLACLTGDRQAAPVPDADIENQVAAVRQAMPGMDVLLLTNQEARTKQVARIDAFLQRHRLAIDDFDDADLHNLGNVHNQDLRLDEAAWPMDGNHREALCIVTLNRADYRRAGARYWQADWSVPEGMINMDLDPVAIGHWDINHELFHCMARPLHLEHPRQLKSPVAQALYDESSADAYAGLAHIRQGGDTRLIEVVANIRMTLVRKDREHYTSSVLDYIYRHPQQYNRATLRHLSPVKLAYVAHRIVSQQWPQLQQDLDMTASDNVRRTIRASGYRHLQELAAAAGGSRTKFVLSVLCKFFRCPPVS